MPFCVVFLRRLCHYERKWGTTTDGNVTTARMMLYHHERKWGTTTPKKNGMPEWKLYHYGEKMGNYDMVADVTTGTTVIPLREKREKMGKYDLSDV